MKILSSIRKFTFLATLIPCTFTAVQAQLPPLQQCSPTLIPNLGAGCGTATQAYIRSVTTTGGIVNISNLNTNCGNTTTSYSDYTGTSLFVRQEAYKTVDVNVTWNGRTSPAPAYTSTLTKVFIDWNRDGMFDGPDEYIAPPPFPPTAVHPHSHANNSTLTVKVTVPGHAKEGQTRMRIITASLGSVHQLASSVTPCFGGQGEAEDYVFEVINPCLPPNVISIANVDYKSADFSWTPKLNAEFYEYLITPLDIIPHDTVIGYTFTNNTAVDVDTFKCDTKYYVLVRLICDSAGRIARDYKKSSWIRDSFTTHACCYAPKLTLDNITSTTMRVQWDPIATAYGYEYAVTTLPSPPQQGTYTTNNILFLQGLSSKTNYYVHVRSRCTPTPLSEWSKEPFKTLPTLSVDNTEAQKYFTVALYPNPVKDIVNVKLDGNMSANPQVSVLNINGMVVHQQVPAGNNFSINLSALPSGIYIIRYTDDINNQVVRLHKQ